MDVLAKSLIVLAAGLLPASGAMAEESPGWHGYAQDGIAALYYGIPQSDYGALSFSCEAGNPSLTFTYAFEPEPAADGVEFDVTLVAGDIEVPLHMVGMRLEMDDQFLLHGETELDARLIDLLTSRGTLLIFIGDGAEEYPLTGAREAAAPLIDTCATTPDMARSRSIASCSLDAWVETENPEAAAIRSEPDIGAAPIADMPPPYPGYDGIHFPTVRITGSADGWFRISEAVTNLYAEQDAVIAFAGEGWIPGEVLRLWVESPALMTGPSHDAPVAASLADGDSTFVVDQLHTCTGPWVEVSGSIAGQQLRGWSANTCESQITTCP